MNSVGPTLSRRRALALSAASALPLVGCDGVPPQAVAAWNGPSDALADRRLRALAWALLAPSPHNTQPWQVALEGDDAVVLGVDPGRLLPVVDPEARQALIAQGAFLEILALAAAARGERAEVTLFPDGEPEGTGLAGRAVARVRFVPGAAGDRPDLLAALPRRRSSRLAFDLEKPVTGADADRLRRATAGHAAEIGFAVEPGRVAALRDLAWETFRAELASARALAETGAWLRLGADEVARRPDGIALVGPGVRWLRRTGLLSRESLRRPGSLAWRVGLLQWRNLFAGTASFGWLVTPDDGLRSRVAAGRAYLRVDLAAAAAGVAIHPVSQALGDRPETAGARRRLEELLEVRPPARVQTLFRLGYAGPQPPSPRRPLDHVVRGLRAVPA